jgi:DsbC/DsbD-like thiol-disulfide interchange protein
MGIRSTVAVAAVAIACTASTDAIPSRVAKGRYVTVELVAARQNGGEVWAAVRFRLDPGWHVYWRNPGDSGGPPRIEWTHLPAGWSAGQIDWPTPARISVDRLVNYGYTGEVLLPVRLTPSPHGGGPPPASSDGPIVADVRWIVCHDVCVPGKATVGLPAGQIAAPASDEWAALIARARDSVPRPAPKSWRATFREEREAFTVSIVMDHQAERGTFFPIDESHIDDAAPQQVSVSDNTLRFRLRKSDQLSATPTALRGVVVFTSGAAYEILATCANPDASKSR